MKQTFVRLTLALALLGLFSATVAAQVTPPYQAIRFALLDDGTATTPSLTFTFDRDTGIYRIGSNNMGVTLGGTLKADWNATRYKLASGYQFTVGANNLIASDLLDATKLSGIVPSTNGGSASAFFAVSGLSSSVKTFAFPNASATVLTDNTAVTTTQGGTGASTTATSARYLKGNGTTWATSSGSASGTGGCTNQFARTLNSDAAPTCATVVSTDVDSTIVTLAGTDVLTGRKDFQQYSEKKNAPTISGNALTVDLSTGSWFVVSLNANITTLTLSNPPASGKVGNAALVFVADGTVRTITWPAAVKWPSGTAPTMTGTNGKIDVVTLITYDGGTSYLAFLGGQVF